MAVDLPNMRIAFSNSASPELRAALPSLAGTSAEDGRFVPATVLATATGPARLGSPPTPTEQLAMNPKVLEIADRYLKNLEPDGRKSGPGLFGSPKFTG
jgi:hypothetical protein